jgi:tetratricopeptide (TPR) repeat protein
LNEKGTDGAPSQAPKTSPLISQEELAKNYRGDADDDLEAEKMVPGKPEAANDQALDITIADENVPMAGFAVEDLKEEEVVESEEDKKTSFWEKSKLVLPAATSGQNRSEQQSLSQDGDHVAKEDNQSKDARTKSGEAKKAERENPAAPEAPAVNTVAASEDYSGTMTDSVQVAGPALGNAANKNLELSYTNGVNLMNSGQYNSAITFFDEVLQDSTHVRYEDAEFQKAKALVKASRKDEAKILLKAIEAKKGKHAAEAAELLKTL